MNLPRKTIITAGVLGTVGLSGLVGVGMASAESGQAGSTNPMSSLVDSIASKFNLNKADVQKVIDEQKTKMDATREAERTEKLQKLVDDGTITASQKTAIESKIKELQSEREANKDSMENLTEDERKAKMESQKAALETWAKEQNLDLTKLDGVLMGGPGHGGPRGVVKPAEQ